MKQTTSHWSQYLDPSTWTHFLQECCAETDHKPLPNIWADSLPPRMLRFRLDRFNYTIEYVPGKELYTADTLSHAPVESQNHPEEDMQEQLFAEMIVTGLPASADRLETFRQAQQNDPVCSKLLSYCHDGWPSKYNISPDLREYWQYRASLHDSGQQTPAVWVSYRSSSRTQKATWVSSSVKSEPVSLFGGLESQDR